MKLIDGDYDPEDYLDEFSGQFYMGTQTNKMAILSTFQDDSITKNPEEN